jgi:hypothetical protein
MEGFSKKYGITRKVDKFEPTTIGRDIWKWIFGDTLIPRNQILQEPNKDDYDDCECPAEPYEEDMDESDNVPNSQDGE